jgi:hypothetical protein
MAVVTSQVISDIFTEVFGRALPVGTSVPRDERPVPPCGGGCGPEGCMATGCPVGRPSEAE